MKIFYLYFFFSLLIDGLVLKLASGLELSQEISTAILIALNLITFGAIITKAKDNRGVLFVILISLLIKIFLIYFDIYGRSIFILPNSGADSEVFWDYATSDIPLSKINMYSKVLRIETILFGENRIFLQYINAILGTLSQLTIIGTMDLLKIRKHTIYSAGIIMALLPNTLIINSILLRESTMIWLMAISLYLFVKWYSNRKKSICFYLSLIPILTATALHSSMIFSIIPYSFFYIFLSKTERNEKLHFNRTTIIKFLTVSCLVLVAFNIFSSTLFSYFGGLDSFEKISTKMTNYSSGGSAYLTSIAQSKNPVMIIVTMPIKFLYFYASPVPLDWRGLSDIIAFLLSSLVFIIVIYKIVRIKKKNTIELFVATTLIIMGFVYGSSCFNSGTAMRHREKMYPFVAIAIPYIIDTNQKHKRKLQEEVGTCRKA